MTYIGQQPSTTFDSGIQDRFTGLTTNTVTLTHDISAETDILVVWNNIVQDSGTYSVGGTGNKTLTLGGTLVSADIVTVYYTNKVMQSVNPTAGSVNTEQLASSAVTDAKIADVASSKLTGTIATARLGSGTASSSTFLRGDSTFATAGGVAGTESFKVVIDTEQTVTSGTYTLVNYDKEVFDNGGNYDTSNKKYTAPATGTYQFNIIMSFATNGSYGLDNIAIQLYKNGSGLSNQFTLFNAPTHTGSGSFDSGSIGVPVLIDLSANDYIQIYGRAIKNSNASSCFFYSDNERRSEWSGFRVT